ncbi:S8 family serine peptidase [Rhizorhabdus dicambivorans]|uniref:Serine protease n=1 Tax=Rhizorhabdus dicambivorans TaxID=1850238 RepID=A0A2A4FTZ4_9SPHN|nr:S8 family serine peptidase [Rhizorhabdus dicambivorans]ATE66894.1 serine protease [Rhizorhabdus dicambivorans]PCE42237.1 serine protease [Rhizorhabdus dicambivorans]
MKLSGPILAMAAALALSGSGAAQLLPPVGGAIGQTIGGVTERVGRIGDRLDDSVDQAGGAIGRLARDRLGRIDALVRANPQALEYDARGDAAVKGELILLDPDPAALRAAMAAGFAVEEQGDLAGLGIAAARLRVPASMDLARAEKLLRRIAPGATVQSNPVYQTSGEAAAPARAAPAASAPGPGAPIGMIDGGVARHPALPDGIVQRGFAAGAPAPGNHGTAVASILVGRGAVRGVSPRSRLLAADVYGRDPRGGNALAIARALGWLAQSGAAVVNISLAGPDNALLARAVAAASGKGLLLVAAVGNDGAASPPAYPASYPQVIAVTGIDAKRRVLIEAGKASHVDFAAPGADLLAAKADGGTARLRGTSYAAPFITGRLARLSAGGPLPRARAVALLAAEATPAKGRAGRGIICMDCATR